MGKATRFIGDLQRCDVKPGDRFIITTDRPLTTDQIKVVQDRWCEFIGNDAARPFVISPGWKVGVLGPEPESEPDLTSEIEASIDAGARRAPRSFKL